MIKDTTQSTYLPAIIPEINIHSRLKQERNNLKKPQETKKNKKHHYMKSAKRHEDHENSLGKNTKEEQIRSRKTPHGGPELQSNGAASFGRRKWSTSQASDCIPTRPWLPESLRPSPPKPDARRKPSIQRNSPQCLGTSLTNK